MSINKIILTGRLTADPDIRFTKEEMPIARFEIADNGGREAKGRKIQFFQCLAKRGLAMICAEYLKKGSLVAVEGSMVAGAPENKKKGIPARFYLDIDNMLMLDKNFMKQAGEVARAGTSLEKNTPDVIIEVSGGVAEITKAPDGLEVKIIDHDNEAAEGLNK